MSARSLDEMCDEARMWCVHTHTQTHGRRAKPGLTIHPSLSFLPTPRYLDKTATAAACLDSRSGECRLFVCWVLLVCTVYFVVGPCSTRDGCDREKVEFVLSCYFAPCWCNVDACGCLLGWGEAALTPWMSFFPSSFSCPLYSSGSQRFSF